MHFVPIAYSEATLLRLKLQIIYLFRTALASLRVNHDDTQIAEKMVDENNQVPSLRFAPLLRRSF